MREVTAMTGENVLFEPVNSENHGYCSTNKAEFVGHIDEDDNLFYPDTLEDVVKMWQLKVGYKFGLFASQSSQQKNIKSHKKHIRKNQKLSMSDKAITARIEREYIDAEVYPNVTRRITKRKGHYSYSLYFKGKTYHIPGKVLGEKFIPNKEKDKNRIKQRFNPYSN
jgi:hypothetical protein